jgi:GAF domain-containing protein
VTDETGDPEDPNPDSAIANLGLTSSITVPLLTDEAAVGLLTLRRKTDAGFDTGEVDLLGIVANQLGPSVHNSL